MAKIGVSNLWAAKYAATAGVVGYTAGAQLAKTTKIDVSIDSADDAVLYADNAPCETAKSFAGGSVKITVADITQEHMATLMGITADSRTVGTETVSELSYDDDRNPPDMGIGFVVKKQVDNVIKWRAIILKKVKFGVPALSVETQGKTITFQADEIDGTIMRDDGTAGQWMLDATLDTEAKAVAYIKAVLEVS